MVDEEMSGPYDGWLSRHKIQMEKADFCEIMTVLHCVGLMMARDSRTKTDDERWALFARVVDVVTKYDKRFQPDEPATDSANKETVK